MTVDESNTEAKPFEATVTFRAVTEDKPGDVWLEIFRRGWPGWKEWFVARGGKTRPDLEQARRALRRYMPELESLWETLVETAGTDETAARFLTFWTPPRYLVNCSQAVIIDQDGPILVRNYDLDPALNEGTLLRSSWRNRPVIGMVDGMAGLADGMNDSGLVLSLTFGGRVVVGKGFGIPLIIRYVLEICSNTEDAIEVLRSVPSHMSYNVTVVDKSGSCATVFLSPDRPPIVRDTPWTTNHQLGVEWPRHGRISNTVTRAEFLETLLATRSLTGDSLVSCFHRSPLFSVAYDTGFGTVYTSTYRPQARSVSLSWGDGFETTTKINKFEPMSVTVAYGADGSNVVHREGNVEDDGERRRNRAYRLRNTALASDSWKNLNGLGRSEPTIGQTR